MSGALEQHQATVSIGSCNITNLCFIDNIDHIAGKEELVNKVRNLEEILSRYGMEINAEKNRFATIRQAS